MSDQTPASVVLTLPENPNLEWLHKTAKKRLAELRKTDPKAKLSEAQFALAKEYGFASWRALKARVDSLTIEGKIIETARSGDVEKLKVLLDQHPDKLHLRVPPYEASLLFPAAQSGNVEAVDLLLKRGLDVNYRERGDNTYAMHWAAAAGKLDMVRKLADAGGDVIGGGEDHVSGVIGWAACWPISNDDAHRAVVDFLISRGARHHIFSAIAMNLGDEVRRIVAADPVSLNQRMHRTENHQTPLHYAVRMKRREMVDLLLELGADPLAVDGDGFSAVMYSNNTDTDRRLMEKVRELVLTELDSAERGHRPANASTMDLVAALSFGDWKLAERLVRENAALIERGMAKGGALHLLAKRGDASAVKWLLEHGADPNAFWGHWDARLTALHLAAAQGHVEVVRLLLEAGADPSIRDSKHDGDAIGWAQYGSNPQAPNWREVVQIIEGHSLRK